MQGKALALELIRSHSTGRFQEKEGLCVHRVGDALAVKAIVAGKVVHLPVKLKQGDFVVVRCPKTAQRLTFPFEGNEKLAAILKEINSPEIVVKGTHPIEWNGEPVEVSGGFW